MSLKPWKKISEETLVENQWWKFKYGKFETAEGGEVNYYYGDLSDASMVVPMNAEGKIGMVRQYRVLLDGLSWEFPCGAFEKSENEFETASRELMEEMKVGAESIEKIGKFQEANARLDQWIHYYFASKLTDEQLEADDNEEFEQDWFTISQIHEKIASGEISDGTTVTAFYLLLSHLDKIKL